MGNAEYEQPIFLKPVLMEKVWGGNRIASFGMGKQAEPGKIIGESWELVDRPEAQSVVLSGPWAGKTLRTIIEEDPQLILGTEFAAAKPARFPLLCKYVDAGSALSVQVHPDDDGAKPFKDRGKSECWIVVHAEADSRITRGLRPGTTRADYERAVANECVEDVLHSFTPKVGDVLALPPGMVHAIGAGIMVAEIQQNSDLTLRIYDYRRVGLDGKPRPLHVKEALESIRFNEPGCEFTGDMRADTVKPISVKKLDGLTVELIFKGKYFDLARHTIDSGGSEELPAMPDAPRVMMAVAGRGELAGRPISAGQTVLLPACVRPMHVQAAGRDGLTLMISAPTLAAC
jgi:mannose-6-phosphate isomerase